MLGEDTGDGQTIEIGFHQSLWSGLWEEGGVNIWEEIVRKGRGEVLQEERSYV